MSKLNEVQIIQNKIFEDNRGFVKHFFKKNTVAISIEETYFSSVKKGVTKGWKYHSNKNQLLTCIVGEVNFFIGNENLKGEVKKIKTINLIANENKAIFIPTCTWYAFEGISKFDAILVNNVDKEHSKCVSKIYAFS